jgi:nucleoside-diphosphate-sugar epimerase
VSKTYVGDVGPAVERALTVSAARGEVFNLCEERSPTIRLWAEQILSAAGARLELVSVPDSLLPDDLALSAAQQPLLASSAKARRLLGWRDTDPVAALERSVAWHLAHPPGDVGDFSADDRALGDL